MLSVETQRELVDFLAAFERWEANLILCNECWASEDGLPQMTDEIYDEWLEMQAKRNELQAKAHAELGAST